MVALTFVPFYLSYGQKPLSSVEKIQSEELGKVKWYRDYDQAIVAATKENKDIVILFQEVPGCSTCRNYGHNVLSSPLMVEALENSFIPLAIFNNKEGKDKQILEKYNEPSWNNPVVRIVDSKGINLTKRIGNDYSALTLCKRLKQALTIRGTPVPEYIKTLEKELVSLSSTHIREASFEMYCFWTGEKQLGKVDGVLDVEAGFINNKEVVKVKYDNSILSESKLKNYAEQQNFRPTNNSDNYKTAVNDVHYYLLHSDYRYLPLSELQKTKINSAVGSKLPAEKYLSPQQPKWLHFIKRNAVKKVSLHNKKIEVAWKIMLESSHIKNN